MFNKLIDKLNEHPKSYDQTSIPNTINIVNEIRRIRTSVSEDDWVAARIQRNFMVHDYPHIPVLWKYAWEPLKKAIEPVGFAVQNLFTTIPQVKQQLGDLRKVC